MPKYFELDRIRQAIEHLSHYRSEWIIVPLVFAVNEVTTTTDVDPNAKEKNGTDRFLEKHFNGSLIGLPPVGNNSLRPKFADVETNSGDLVAHQAVKLWGSHYSSRGYREMAQKGLLTIDGKRYRLNMTFWQAWEQNLPVSFHFEELLVWLYAFSGIPDQVNSWDALYTDFQEKYLGPGGRVPADYNRRFRVNNGVPWPNSFLRTRPTDAEFQKTLLPSRFKKKTTAASVVVVPEMDVEILVGEFDAALTTANMSFGSTHAALVRTFVVSMLTKPFVIITGLSGSGKTQVAKKFGEWLGDSRYLLVPVRPDWGTGDPLFGYENLLDTKADRQWIVSDALQFMLQASSDPKNPYLLILDEMNLAHVERYFGDFLSGIESGTDVIPNLVRDNQGLWRAKPAHKNKIPIPPNLIVVGTVNVDETTYMFSPKVLDRANTLEFRVLTEDLAPAYAQLIRVVQGRSSALEGIVQVMTDRQWLSKNPGAHSTEVSSCLRTVHKILSESSFEFGHRTFIEAIRFGALFEAAGGEWKDAVDAQIYQKILPRLHGSQRAVGNTLRSLGHYCRQLPTLAEDSISRAAAFNFDEDGAAPELPLSYWKLRRMYNRLRTNQFTTFIE